MAELLDIREVPQAFCERYCCAWVGGACRSMSGGCLWPSALAAQAMERRRDWMNRELFGWVAKLER